MASANALLISAGDRPSLDTLRQRLVQLICWAIAQ
jgi:hypothetical protein